MLKKRLFFYLNTIIIIMNVYVICYLMFHLFFFYIYFTNFTSLPLLCRRLWIIEVYFGLIWEVVTRERC